MDENVANEKVNPIEHIRGTIAEVNAKYPFKFNMENEHVSEVGLVEALFKESHTPVNQSVESAASSYGYNIDIEIQEHSIKLEPLSFSSCKETVSKISRDALEETINSNFPSKDCSEKFQEIHSEDRKCRCYQCEKGFVAKQSLVAHQATHAGEKHYQNKTFVKMQSLMIPQKIQAGEKEKTYICSHCENCFADRSSLIIHQRIHTGEKPYQCSYCNKRFAQIHSFNMHQRIHTGEKPYQCSYCNKRFSQIHSFRMYQRIHTGEKPYQCSYCNKCFAEKCNMVRHIRTHTGEKPYKCKICNISVASKQKLEMHQLTVHTDDKPHQCTHCEKSFKIKSYLERHVRVHSGLHKKKENLKNCNYCDKVFYRKYHLIRHQRIHTREKPYHCNHCNKGFVYNESDKEKHQKYCKGERQIKLKLVTDQVP